MIKDKLLATSYSLEGIQDLISEYFYGSTIILDQIEDDVWAVSNSKGLIDTCAVFLDKKGKYSFVKLSDSINSSDQELIKKTKVINWYKKLQKKSRFIFPNYPSTFEGALKSIDDNKSGVDIKNSEIEEIIEDQVWEILSPELLNNNHLYVFKLLDFNSAFKAMYLKDEDVPKAFK